MTRKLRLASILAGDKTKMRYGINGVFGKQHKKKLLFGMMRASDLAKMWDDKKIVVDSYSEENPDGYQRKEAPARSRKVSKFVQNPDHGFIPTAIVIYSRTPNGGLVEDDGHLYFDDDQLAKEAKEYEAKVGKNPVTDSTVLYITDGQHRAGGFADAVRKGKLDTQETGEYDVPVSIMFWGDKDSVELSKIEEAEQFHVINTEQKRMKTDLSYKFLYEKHQAESGAIISTTRVPVLLSKKDNLPYAAYIGKFMAENSKSPLRGKVTPINQTKAEAKTMISESSLIDSLHPFLKFVADNNLSMEQATTLLSNFWTAVSNMAPDAFNENPDKYVLLKTPGMYSLHIVLPVLLQRKGAELGMVPTADKFAEVMEAVDDVFTDDFWSTEVGEGSKGIASSYGAGAKAFSMLAQHIVDEISE